MEGRPPTTITTTTKININIDKITTITTTVTAGQHRLIAKPLLYRGVQINLHLIV